MKDLRQSQLSQMHRERRALIEEGVDADKFIARTKQKTYPAGSTHKWALDAVYGPIGSAKEKNNGPAMSMDKERNIDRPPSVPRHDSQGDVEGDVYEPQYAHERYSDHQVEGWR